MRFLKNWFHHLLCVILILFMFSENLTAQQKFIKVDEQLWTGYFNQTRFASKWGLWLDVHLRTKENTIEGLSQGIFRPAAIYYLNDDFKVMAGYAFVNHFPADNHKGISQPEHRLWQQLQWHLRNPKFRLMQWLRLEERFRRNIKNDRELGEGYTFNYRARYNFLAQFALNKNAFKNGGFSFVAGNEIFVNFGSKIVYNYFDQNRFFAGFQYHLNKHDQLQVGYMNLFQQLSGGNQYRMNHIVRIFYFQALDLRKN